METEIPDSLQPIRNGPSIDQNFGVASQLFLFHLYSCWNHLVLTAPSPSGKFAAFIFAFGNSAMLGISALFHRTNFTDSEWMRFRRLITSGSTYALRAGIHR